MKLAFVSTMPSTRWGGCEELWTAAASIALQRGHEVLISVYDWGELHPRVQALVGARAQLHLRPQHRMLRNSAVASLVTRTFRTLTQYSPDVICISQGGTYDLARTGEMQVLHRVLTNGVTPFVILCHCQQPAPKGFKLRRARSAFQRARIGGFLARNLVEISEKDLAMPLTNARIFQNPLKNAAANALPWPSDDTLRMAFVGRLEPVKGLPALFEILQTALWRDRQWSLSIYGTGSLRGALETLVRTSGLVTRVRFAGYVDDIEQVWRDHHVLVMPSLTEGVPLAMQEAMLCARPVVISKVGGVAEWVADGDTGFLASDAGASDFGKALERLWRNKDRLAEMGRMARESTLAKLDRNPAHTLLCWLEEIGSP